MPMEIDLFYLRALIEECADPVAVCAQSQLKGECDSVASAKNTLLKHLGQPSAYNPKDAPVRALRLLGVDVPDGEAIRVCDATKWKPRS